MIVLLALVAVLGGVSYAEGPYYGRVIDRETKQPIDGAAVVAVWYEAGPNRSLRLYEVQEAVTDSQGNFFFPAIPVRSESIRDPALFIYRPGYHAFIPHGLMRLIDGYVAELSATKTHQQRLANLEHATSFTVCPEMPSGQLTPNCIPPEKVPNWVGLVNTEQENLGMKDEPVKPKRPSDPHHRVIK